MLKIFKFLLLSLLISVSILSFCSAENKNLLGQDEVAVSDIKADTVKTVNDSNATAIEIINLNSGNIFVKNQQQCLQRVSPTSTFKIALSLMGFDAGILKDENHPVWACREEYRVPFTSWEGEQNPSLWMKNSVVWYSQELTLMLGMKDFEKYIHSFDYGNMDISGNPARGSFVIDGCKWFSKAGLINCWLGSSLQISPHEQVVFLRKLLENKLSVSQHAIDMTKKILYRGQLSDGTLIYGKTGTGMYEINSSQSEYITWFVGWMEKGDKKYVFASNRFVVVPKGTEVFASKFAVDMTVYLQELLAEQAI